MGNKCCNLEKNQFSVFHEFGKFRLTLEAMLIKKVYLSACMIQPCVRAAPRHNMQVFTYYSVIYCC